MQPSHALLRSPQSLLRRLVSLVKPKVSMNGTGTVALMVTVTESSLTSQLNTTTHLGQNASPAHVPIPRRGVDYRGKIVLAPMVRSGELPSRLLALHYGADLVWGPETVDRSMIGTTKRINPRTGCIEWTRISNNNHQSAGNNTNPPRESIIYRIDPKREAGKLIYQIGSANPDLAVESASVVAPYVSGIDLNSGCPKPFSTSGGMGAALLRTPDKLCSILTALVEKVGKVHEIGISVKIRLLETPELTSELVNRLCKTGITGLTVHCRTTPMRPRERAIRQQLRMIGEICRSHGVACLMNGDVASREEGENLAEEFGVDGGMIATAAESNSSVFRRKTDGGLAPWKEVITEYLKLAMSVENKFGNTKFLLSQLIPGKDAAYQKTQMSRSYAEILAIHNITDEKMVQDARNLDQLLDLDTPKVTKADIKREHKQQTREKQAAKQERKRQSDGIRCLDALEVTKKQKAEIAVENARFDEPAHGALAIAT